MTHGARNSGHSDPAGVHAASISRSILLLRGQRVILDTDLALLYGVQTRVLLQAVRRNMKRFPEDFMLQLTAVEWTALRSQFVILKGGRGQHRKYPPYAFTEQGVAMRTFVRMREMLTSDKELAHKLDQLESRIDKKLTTHDDAITAILSAIRELMNPSPARSRGIGFTADIHGK